MPRAIYIRVYGSVMRSVVALDQTVRILWKSTKDWGPQEGLSWSLKPQGHRKSHAAIRYQAQRHAVRAQGLGPSKFVTYSVCEEIGKC